MNIGYLNGKLKHQFNEKLIVELSSGLGVEVMAHEYNLDQNGDVTLFVSTQAKENSISYYGFSDYENKMLFELLIQVKGIGPKSAFALCSNFKIEELLMAISLEDKDFIKKAPGVGVKAATQIILDLKKKATELLTMTQADLALPKKSRSKKNEKSSDDTSLLSNDLYFKKRELAQVLTELGYQEKQINPVLESYMANLDKNQEMNLSQMTKEVLTLM